MRIPLRRWACLLAGGALLAPYPMMFLVWVSLFHGPLLGLSAPVFIGIVDVLLAAVVGLLPVTRRLEITIARTLLGTIGEVAPARSGPWWRPQWRAGAWYWLHLCLGAVATALLGLTPFVVATCLAAPFVDGVVVLPGWQSRPGGAGVLVAVGSLLAVVPVLGAITVCGTVLARTAPVLLGPSHAERLADLELRARALAERNRLARELHDSIGHALTITTLHAGTAHRLFDRDPAFVRQALAVIEETGRVAMADLDHMIGLLREDAPPQTPPTLADLDRLLESHRALGVTVDTTVTGPVRDVPGTVSREVFRIVQECLTNAAAHAGSPHVTLSLAVTPDQVGLDVLNPVAAGHRPRRGGRGLRGMRERVHLLRGRMTAVAEDAHWHVHVDLPLHPSP